MRLPRLALFYALTIPLIADEGMWLFNAFPKDTVKQKHTFDVTDPFLDNLRLASVRIGRGSGSFVSGSGLIATTRRLTAACIASLAKDSFYAPSQSAEQQCPGMEASVLVALEDVTKTVKDASAGAAKPADILEKRSAAIARIEKDCAQKSGNTCSVVKLYAGERYDLYQYRRYTDLRLVFAPELGIAFFGGEADNFTYPRYDLDVAFLRAYEGGKPAATPHHLNWSVEGVKENEAVFAAGSPGTTSRLASQAQFNFYRTVQLPIELTRLMARIEILRTYSMKSDDARRAAQIELSSLSNTYKSAAGKLIGLKDERLMLRKQQFEKRLRRAVENDPKLGAEAAKVWDEVAAAYRLWAPSEKAFQVLEKAPAQGSELFRRARLALRGSTPESSAPVDEGMEIALLAQYFEELKTLGEKEAPVKAVLQGRTPQQAAEAYVKGSRVKDFAQTIEGPAQKLRKKYEGTIQALEVSALDRIAQYRFKVLGPNEYPDATSTPRLMFGAVKGYRDKTEAPAPYATTFGGLYHRAAQAAPYVLPQQWVNAKQSLDLVVPFNFVSTCDISGSSSGSPTVNTKGELVGIVFDGNIESLSQTYLYSDDQARTVHVASQGIVEALRKVYKTPELLKELGLALVADPKPVL
jgi:hypothetical protein